MAAASPTSPTASCACRRAPHSGCASSTDTASPIPSASSPTTIRRARLATRTGSGPSTCSKGGNALFMLDPFVRTGLEPVIREYGVVVDDDIVIDEASHFWADVSSPAVTSYNHHLVTVDLPLTLFPGVRSLSPSRRRVPGTTVVPLVNSSKNSW